MLKTLFGPSSEDHFGPLSLQKRPQLDFSRKVSFIKSYSELFVDIYICQEVENLPSSMLDSWVPIGPQLGSHNVSLGSSKKMIQDQIGKQFTGKNIFLILVFAFFMIDAYKNGSVELP